MKKVRHFDYVMDYKLLERGEREAYELSFPGRLFEDDNISHRLSTIESQPGLTFVLQKWWVPQGYIVGTTRHHGKRKQGYINSIYLLPEARSKGNGRLLIESLVEALKERDIKTLALDVSAANENAMRAYEKIGFRVSSTTMKFDFEDKKSAEDHGC